MTDKRDGESAHAVSRRQLIKRGGALAGGALIGGGVVGVAEAPTAEAQSAELLSNALKTLTPAQARRSRPCWSACCRPMRPGRGRRRQTSCATSTGRSPAIYGVRRVRIRARIAAIDAYAKAQYGAAFAALSETQQDDVLTDMEAGTRRPGSRRSRSAVFTMIRTHAVQGMFGDPAHGGNVGFVGWKLVGFPGPRLVVDAHDQQLNVRAKNQLGRRTPCRSSSTRRWIE